jgi:Neuraminidase (sialidase)
LHAIAVRHRSIAFLEEMLDMFERRLIENQINARDLGDGFARQVVERRPEAAGGEHQVGAISGDAKDVDILLQIVGDRGVPVNGNADLGKAEMISAFMQ